MKEVFKEINGYDGLYQISNFGRVYSIVSSKFKKPNLGKRGYYVIDLCHNNKRKNVKIHRLIALHFIKNDFNKQFINHKNGVKTDNSISNLEWCTKIENDRHARLTGLNNDIGSNHHNAKLKESEIKEIRIINGYSNQFIANLYGVSRSNINLIKTFKRWNHVK